MYILFAVIFLCVGGQCEGQDFRVAEPYSTVEACQDAGMEFIAGRPEYVPSGNGEGGRAFCTNSFGDLSKPRGATSTDHVHGIRGALFMMKNSMSWLYNKVWGSDESE